jgi:hypothetical protein
MNGATLGFHLGVDPETRTELAEASHKGEEALTRLIASQLG